MLKLCTIPRNRNECRPKTFITKFIANKKNVRHPIDGRDGMRVRLRGGGWKNWENQQIDRNVSELSGKLQSKEDMAVEL